MRLKQIIQKITADYQREIHKSHYTFLSLAIDSVANGARLTCTDIGRNLDTTVSEKHSIKRVNHMLSSQHLHRERKYFYQAMTRTLISPHSKPLIIIDWSNTTPTKTHFLLRACVVMKDSGRALTIYEEIYPQSQYNNPVVHKTFLNQLNHILPIHTKPIIITDAGFRTTWFKQVQMLGWDFVGRVRGLSKFSLKQGNLNDFVAYKDYIKYATSKLKSLGKIELTIKAPFTCNALLIKKKPKGRKKITVMGKNDRCTQSREHASKESEPWLLVSSLTNSKKIYRAYQFRMQIEEGFRDLKSIQFGMGFKHSRTRSKNRFEVLLLIASLTHFLLFILGALAEKKGMAKKFIANTISKKRVISQVFLALRIWKKNLMTPLLICLCKAKLITFQQSLVICF